MVCGPAIVPDALTTRFAAIGARRQWQAIVLTVAVEGRRARQRVAADHEHVQDSNCKRVGRSLPHPRTFSKAPPRRALISRNVCLGAVVRFGFGSVRARTYN